MACFFIVLILWVFSVCLHEFGHAWVAMKGGDYTVREKGYLTLNPIRYTHPVYSIALPLLFLIMGGIGLPGGAVYIERHLLRSKQWDTLVSLGGPAMDVIFIAVIALLFKTGIIPPDPTLVGPIAMAFVLKLQICSVFFNLLPVPPLDGFQAIAPWMPPDARDRMYAMSNFTLLALFMILSYSATANLFFWGLVDLVSELLGVPSAWGWEGYRAFKFWKH
jgi:Zn-dependent protease